MGFNLAIPAQAKGWATPNRSVKRVATDWIVDIAVSFEAGFQR